MADQSFMQLQLHQQVIEIERVYKRTMASKRSLKNALIDDQRYPYYKTAHKSVNLPPDEIF